MSTTIPVYIDISAGATTETSVEFSFLNTQPYTVIEWAQMIFYATEGPNAGAPREYNLTSVDLASESFFLLSLETGVEYSGYLYASTGSPDNFVKSDTILFNAAGNPASPALSDLIVTNNTGSFTVKFTFNSLNGDIPAYITYFVYSITGQTSGNLVIDIADISGNIKGLGTNGQIISGSYYTQLITPSMVQNCYSYLDEITISAKVDTSAGTSPLSNFIEATITNNAPAPIILSAVSGLSDVNGNGIIGVNYSYTQSSSDPVVQIQFQLAADASSSIWYSSNTVDISSSSISPNYVALNTITTSGEIIPYTGYFVRAFGFTQSGAITAYSNANKTAVPAFSPTAQDVGVLVISASSVGNYGTLTSTFVDPTVEGVYTVPNQSNKIVFSQGVTTLATAYGNSGLTYHGTQTNPITPNTTYTTTVTSYATLSARLVSMWQTPTSDLSGNVYYGQPVSANGQSSSIPIAPVTNLAYYSGDASVQVTWTAPIDDGGSPITKYRVYQYTSYTNPATPTSTFYDVSGTLEYVNVTGLTNGTHYYFSVEPYNFNGAGPICQMLTTPAYPSSNDTIAPIAGVALTQATPNSVNITATATANSVPVGWTDASVNFYTITPNGVFVPIGSKAYDPSNNLYVLSNVIINSSLPIYNCAVTISARTNYSPSTLQSSEPEYGTITIATTPTITAFTLSSSDVSGNWSFILNNGGQPIIDGSILLFLPPVPEFVGDVDPVITPVVIVPTSGNSVTYSGTVNYPVLPVAKQPYLLSATNAVGTTYIQSNL